MILQIKRNGSLPMPLTTPSTGAWGFFIEYCADSSKMESSEVRRNIGYTNEYIILKNVTSAAYILLNGNTRTEGKMHGPNGLQDNVTYVQPSLPMSWHPTRRKHSGQILSSKSTFLWGFPQTGLQYTPCCTPYFFKQVY